MYLFSSDEKLLNILILGKVKVYSTVSVNKSAYYCRAPPTILRTLAVN